MTLRIVPALLGSVALTFSAMASLPAFSQEHPAVAREMAGVWLPDSRRSTRPQKLPLNEEAQRAAEQYEAIHGPIDPTVDDITVSCIPEPLPYSMRLIAQYPFEVLFTPGRLTFFFEIYGGIRRIPFDMSRKDDDVLPSTMGHSVARWEGDTAVIETSHIRKDGFGPMSGNPPVSSARRIIERLSMTKDDEGRKQLRNDITIEDPVVFTEPVKFTMHYKWSPDIEVGEYLCQQDIWDQNVQGSPSSVPWRH